PLRSDHAPTAARVSLLVMAGLVQAIHERKTWIPRTNPGMTVGDAMHCARMPLWRLVTRRTGPSRIAGAGYREGERHGGNFAQRGARSARQGRAGAWRDPAPGAHGRHRADHEGRRL